MLIGDSSLSHKGRRIEDASAPILGGPAFEAVPAAADQTPVSDKAQAEPDSLGKDPHADLPTNVVLGTD